MTLDEAGVANATDKSTLRHCYLDLYELIFTRFDDEVSILEIGTQFGNSLKTWKEWFGFPIITGIDAVDNGVQIDRCELLIRDAYTPETVTLFKNRNKVFDIIIDDGSHSPAHQAFVVHNYPEILDFNGIIIIEDVQSKEVASSLKNVMELIPNNTFISTSVEMTHGMTSKEHDALGLFPSRLFIMWRK